MRRLHWVFTALFGFAGVAILGGPTAVLVDTSRSIPPSHFERAKSAIKEAIPSLAASGPVSVYSFNDSPSIAVKPTSDVSELAAGIDGLSQGGNYTLLYDCLFAAVKDLEAGGQGGLILLVTDGKDENSAVTLEDAASRAETAGVAVVPAGIGGWIDARSLRRLAALTGGVYAGDLMAEGTEGLAKAGDSARQALETRKPPAPLPAPKEEPAVSRPAPPVQEEKGISGLLLGLLLLLVLLVLAGVAVLIVLYLRRTKEPAERVCDACGKTLNIWEKECPACLAKSLAITHPGVSADIPAAPPIPEIDPALRRKAPSSEELENTLILDEVPILVLQRGKNPPRVFQLPPDQVVSIGRDKVNTISVADPTLSGQHFRIVPKDSVYYLVDLQSTNGTYLNGERASLKEIPVGSVIHAGQCDFTFKREQRRLN